MNVMVSLYLSDVSWADIGPMTGTVSSKSCVTARVVATQEW